ncbi:helix-turn-helix domain-containing protein [Streptomyces sp. NPDC006476]|uniref:PucR family transcriptional regulator n=1 Tax=Streptomyces sp. NPDC006476 TaxID=3157175 RepID=UPI0033A55010
MSEEVPHPGIIELSRALERDTEVVEPSVRRVWDEVPSYLAATREQLEASVRRNLRLAARTVLTRKVLSPAEIWEAEQATLERLSVGIPIEDIMTGFRVSISSIEDRLIELAAVYEVPAGDVVALTRLLRQLGDAFSARAASAYREQGVTSALAEQRRRDRWLLALLTGDLDAVEVEHGATSYRLGRHRAYVPFCSAGRGPGALEALLENLTEQFRGHGVAMMLPVEDQLVGILPEAPKAVDGHLIALGPPVRPDETAASFALARRVLAAASVQSDGGVHTVEALGWRIGVPVVPELAALVSARYLDPLRQAGAFGDEVEQTLRAYLEHDRSIPRTSEATHLHVNTLRYRLARFEELTGRSLAQTDTLIELAWALQLRPPS